MPYYLDLLRRISTGMLPQHFKDAVLRRAVTGKMGTLDQMEGIAVFLASAASDFMTGQNIIIDGGHTIHPM